MIGWHLRGHLAPSAAFAANHQQQTPMDTTRLETAIAEAERFLNQARELQAEQSAAKYITGSRLSGATRRASMDLTRALADLRRPA
jgi:hypothetical protein